jgi:hypothetical protein
MSLKVFDWIKYHAVSSLRYGNRFLSLCQLARFFLFFEFLRFHHLLRAGVAFVGSCNIFRSKQPNFGPFVSLEMTMILFCSNIFEKRWANEGVDFESSASLNDMETLYLRADIRRATSLRDLRVRTYAFDSQFQWRAQYEIEIENRVSQNNLSWRLLCSFADVKNLFKRLKKLLKNQINVETKSGAVKHLQSFHSKYQLLFLRSIFSGKAHTISLLLELLFRTLAENADQLSTCSIYREMLRITEHFCIMEYPQDQRALQLLRQMKSIDSASLGSDDEDCCICLCADEAVLETPQRVALKCGHVFHESCICVWYYTRLNCPICRQ